MEKKVAVYYRSSIKNDLGTQAQADLLMRMARKAGYTDKSMEVFCDNGYSVLDEERPDFLKLIERAGKSEFGSIYVTDPKRLAGTYKEMKELLEVLSEQGVSIYAYDEKSDSMKKVSKRDWPIDMMLSLDIPDNEENTEDDEIDY